MSGTGWTRRLKSGNGNVEETHPELRAGDPNAADACLSCLGPAAPRAREGVNVLRSRNTIFSYIYPEKVGLIARQSPKTVTPPNVALRTNNDRSSPSRRPARGAV